MCHAIIIFCCYVILSAISIQGSLKEQRSPFKSIWCGRYAVLPEELVCKKKTQKKRVVQFCSSNFLSFRVHVLVHVYFSIVLLELFLINLKFRDQFKFKGLMNFMHILVTSYLESTTCCSSILFCLETNVPFWIRGVQCHIITHT